MIPDRTISSLIKSPTALPQKGPIGGLADKPETFPLGGKIPVFKGIPLGDRIKNALSRVGEKFGLTTHIITDKDYVFKPKLDKDGKEIINQKTGEKEGSWQWGGWDLARRNDAEAGRAIRTEFSIDPLLNLGLKAVTKGAM